MNIVLEFVNGYPISEAYREKLQTFSNNILDQGITENLPPSIRFPGMNDDTFDKIYKLRRDILIVTELN